MNIKEIDGVKYIPYSEHEKTVIMAIQLEREACALVCDDQMEFAEINTSMAVAAGNCADLIRERTFK